jgi:hypothetical protein
MNKIFLVLGKTGEYEDTKEWLVCAYSNVIKAKLHVKRLNDCALLIKVHQNNFYKFVNKEKSINIIKQLDSHIHHIDDNGVIYSYTEIDLLGVVPKIDMIDTTEDPK